MTTAQTIIQAAYREGNLIPIGGTPTDAENSEALERLNRYVQGVYGYELGEPMIDWLIPAPQRTASVAANFPQLPFPIDGLNDIITIPFASDPTIAIYPYAPKNSRIVFGNVTNTCFFPEAPEAGSRMMIIPGSGAGDGGVNGAVLTLNGNGRFIEGAAQQTYTSPITARSWLYREDLGNWIAIVDMALTDQMPFPSDFDDFWICALAIRLAPRYGKVINVSTSDTFKSMLNKIKARYRQTQNTVYGSDDFPRSLQSYISGRWWWLFLLCFQALSSGGGGWHGGL